MKKIIGVSALAIILSFSAVSAANDGIPLQIEMLWNAIGDLQNQISNIQLLPGPKGDKGVKGDPALMGAGNVAFVVGNPLSGGVQLLSTDGNLYDLGSEGGHYVWKPRLSPPSLPVPVSQIVTWEPYRLLDKNGDVWIFTGIWQNVSHP